MNVSADQPSSTPTTDPASSTPAPATSAPARVPAADSKGAAPKSFAKILREKQEQPDEQAPAFGGAAVPMPFDSPAPVVPQTAAPVKASEAPMVQNLVQEIVVAAAPGGGKTVDVQFNSQTLQGLHVQVTSGDNIAIKFSTSSQSVSQLLSRNVDQLTQALEARGLHVAPIQVEMGPAPTMPLQPGSSGSGTSQDGRRGQGESRQQQKRQK